MNPISTKNIFGIRIARYVLVIVVALTMLVGLSGCLQNYGHLRTDAQVGQSFDNYQVPQDYKYYYFGLAKHPQAIIGIDKSITLKSRLWREADPNSERFKLMIFWIWPGEVGYYYSYKPLGKNILDPEGNKIGVWYSYSLFAAVKFSEDRKTIEVMPGIPHATGPNI